MRKRYYISRHDVSSMVAWLTPAEVIEHRDNGFMVTLMGTGA